MTGRRLPVGAEVLPEGGVEFRVWADERRTVELVLEGRGSGEPVPLEAEESGYFSVVVPSAGAGTLYRYRLDGGEALLSDPASRFQPAGPHGPSQVIDPGRFGWTDQDWGGALLEGQVIYEMHVGTFTREGTWAAAMRELDALRELGITAVEVMPVADFAGRFGWGYDGVNLFAPTRLYGAPDDFRRFVDRAHALGLAVILDVVYNHLGPSGNVLPEFSPRYFTDRYENDWGESINFDGPGSAPVRELFIANAGYWISEFHVDGLRLDATPQVVDRSPRHILGDIARRARQAAGARRVLLIAEDETQDVDRVTPHEAGGVGLDAVWNDDFHHSAIVAATGRNEAYFSDFLGSPQELISALKRGFLYQGQFYSWHQEPRGTLALDLPPAVFVNYLQNHDQVANSATGLRLHDLTSPGRYRALTALLLIGPSTPLIFQGQEFAASAPFLFFADHEDDLAEAVRQGRAEFLSQFRTVADPAVQARLPDPSDLATFQRCKLDLSERERHAETYALHRDLLRLRREDPVLSRQQPGGVDGAVLAEEAFVLRFLGSRRDEDRLLVVNLGRQVHLTPSPEPLLAPPVPDGWAVRWSSDDSRYGGPGVPPVETDEGWWLPAHAAVLLAATRPGNRAEAGARTA